MNIWEAIEERRENLLADYAETTQQVAEMRRQTISNLADLEKMADVSLKGKGTNIYYAKDAQEAAAIIKRLCPQGEKVVRKNAAELKEIDFDQIMAENENTLYLTDMSEIIAKEAGQAVNSHPLVGQLNQLSESEIIKALQQYVGSEDIDEPKALAKLTKDMIKRNIIASGYGVTGIDGVIAENGTIVLAENEGNGRMVSNLPYRHIAVAGLDKLYPTAEDAARAIQTSYIYGLGHNNAHYYSFISGQSRTADIEFRMVYGMHGPLEVHLILLDNGRNDLIAKGAGKLLQCINCGACTKALLPLAEANRWQDMVLNCKNIALLKTQKKISYTKEVTLENFVCPVEITKEDFLTALEK